MKKNHRIGFCVSIILFLCWMQMPSAALDKYEGHPQELGLSHFFTDLYAEQDALKETVAYQGASWVGIGADALSQYPTLGFYGALLYGTSRLAQYNTGSLVSLLVKMVCPWLPHSLRGVFNQFMLDRLQEFQAHTYCQYPVQHASKYVLGTMGLFVARSVCQHTEMSDFSKTQLKGIVYYCCERAGWAVADEALSMFSQAGQDNWSQKIQEGTKNVITLVEQGKYGEAQNKILSLPRRVFGEHYTNVTCLDNGSSHTIYRVTIPESEGCPSPCVRVLSIKRDRSIFVPAEVMASAIYYNQMRQKGIVTSYLLPILGLFYVAIPTDRLSDVLPEFPKGRSQSSYTNLMAVEFPFVNGPDFEAPMAAPFIFDPRVLITTLLGEYSVRRGAGLDITDYDGDVLRHYMIHKEVRPLVLSVGPKFYLFPGGYEARKVDYDSFSGRMLMGDQIGDEVIPFTDSSHCSFEEFSTTLPIQPEMQLFMEDVCAGKGLFKSIYTHFKSWEITEDHPILKSDAVTRYTFPEKLRGSNN